MSKFAEQQALMAEGCAHFSLSSAQAQNYLSYLNFLLEWNRSINLTAITDPKEMVIKHIFDSLSISQYLQGSVFLDVGTGAGLPGMVLAIANPHQQWHLLDMNFKRTVFLRHVKQALNVMNVTIHHGRVEDFSLSLTIDGVVTRAFSSVDDFIQLCAPLLTEKNKAYLMKADVDVSVKSTCDPFIQIENIVPLNVPFLEAKRHLVVLSRNNTTAGSE